jgi:hypothetical protein
VTASADSAAAIPEGEAAFPVTGSDVERVLGQLTEKLRGKYDDRLVSVVLYGSAAAGDHQDKFSDVNVLCVLRTITPRELGECEEIFRWWREQGNPAPLLLSEQEVVTATDCFAIEFHDIKSYHRIVFGKDVISGLVVDDSFYRAHVEYELRAKLLRLRQKASGVLSEKNLLPRLLADSIATFCVLFRHALLLHGEQVPAKKREIIAAAGRRFGFDVAPFEKVLDLRDERVKPGELGAAALLGPYLAGIETVIEAVDRLAK